MVVSVECIVGAVTEHSHRLGDGERVTRDAHRRLFWRLFALGEFSCNRDLRTGRHECAAIAVVVLFSGRIVAFRRILIGWHRPHICRINRVGQVEQAASGGLLDEVVEDFVNDVVEVSEEAIDRLSRRRSIEATTEPDDCVVQFSRNRTNAVDVL